MDRQDRKQLADAPPSLMSRWMPMLIQINDGMLNKAGLVSEQFIGSKTLGRHETLWAADGS